MARIIIQNLKSEEEITDKAILMYFDVKQSITQRLRKSFKTKLKT